MASFRRLQSGNFQATIYCGKDKNGKQIRKSVTRCSLKECKIEARKIQEEYENSKNDYAI